MRIYTKGLYAEHLALSHLKKHQLIHIASRVRCRFGEIDLIMQQQQTTVFIEVKGRKDDYFHEVFSSITPKKQQNMIRCAKMYMQRHDLSQRFFVRFDAVAVNLDTQTCIWLPGAFDAL